MRSLTTATKTFQSTPPVRGATYRDDEYSIIAPISIHAPRAGGDHIPDMTFEVFYISIHAPRAGSDERLALRNSVVIAISIHAPRAGSD